MRAPRNPCRRNRNIGTAKQGRGKNNSLVVPGPDSRSFVDRLTSPISTTRQVAGVERTFVVEPPRKGCFYPCSVDDLAKVLSLLPSDDIRGLDLFVFRQPTRKQRILSCVWGRFLYFAEPGPAKGSAVCIEATDLTCIKWSRSLDPDYLAELERLRSDGHDITSDRRSITITPTRTSLRNTVLFRTAIHEVGHYVDWNRIWQADLEDDELEEELQRFDTKISKEKEQFANRYADEVTAALRKAGDIPFPPIIDADKIAREGMLPKWFAD